MGEALAVQGPDVLDALVAEVADGTRDHGDDEGWAAPQATTIMTAVAGAESAAQVACPSPVSAVQHVPVLEPSIRTRNRRTTTSTGA
jgi:hypothetical protein